MDDQVIARARSFTRRYYKLKYKMKPQSTRRLVLYFNIDKINVCRDPYNGLEIIQFTIMDCVARMWWGKVNVENDVNKWILLIIQR